MSPDAITPRRRVSAKAIKAALRRAGYPGKSQGAVSMVIAGDMKSLYIAERIAAVVGKPASAIWPRHYPAA